MAVERRQRAAATISAVTPVLGCFEFNRGWLPFGKETAHTASSSSSNHSSEFSANALKIASCTRCSASVLLGPCSRMKSDHLHKSSIVRGDLFGNRQTCSARNSHKERADTMHEWLLKLICNAYRGAGSYRGGWSSAILLHMRISNHGEHIIQIVVLHFVCKPRDCDNLCTSKIPADRQLHGEAGCRTGHASTIQQIRILHSDIQANDSIQLSRGSAVYVWYLSLCFSLCMHLFHMTIH